jgi:hypothetical protein
MAADAKHAAFQGYASTRPVLLLVQVRRVHSQRLERGWRDVVYDWVWLQASVRVRGHIVWIINSNSLSGVRCLVKLQRLFRVRDHDGSKAWYRVCLRLFRRGISDVDGCTEGTATLRPNRWHNGSMT